MRRTLLAVTLLALLGADWPRFRGPNGTGVADAPAATLGFDPQKPLFKVELPPGYGSPIIAGGALFVQSSRPDGSERTLHALDPATGVQLWAKARPGATARVHRKNSLATGTPTADASRVYEVVYDGSDLRLLATGRAGEPLWSADLGPFKSQHGPGLSPVTHAGKVYVNLDQDGDARVMAFDAATGVVAWNVSRRPFRASYAAPVVRALPGGKSEIVVASTAGLTGYDPDSGGVNWDWSWQFGGNPLRSVSTPLIVGDTVIASAGDGGGSRSLVCVRPGATPKLAWELRRDVPYVPSLIASGGHLYWVTDSGVASCADAATGKVAWSERLFSGAVSASPVMAGGAILAIAEDGKAATFRATPAGFEKLSDAKLAGPVLATPAVAGGRLYVRTAEGLTAFGAK